MKSNCFRLNQRWNDQTCMGPFNLAQLLLVGLLLVGDLPAPLQAEEPLPPPSKTNEVTPPDSRDLHDRSQIGALADGRIIVPTNQVLSPAGQQVIVGGRPTDVALAPNGLWLAVLNLNEIQLINVESGEILSHAAHKGGSFEGIAFTPDNKRLFASSTKGIIGVFDVSNDGQLAAATPISIPAKRTSRGGGALPVGMVVQADGKSLLVALNLKNTLGEIDSPLRQRLPLTSHFHRLGLRPDAHNRWPQLDLR